MKTRTTGHRKLAFFALTALLAIACITPIQVHAQGIFVPQPRGSGESLDEGAGGEMTDPEMLTNVVYTRMGDRLRGRVRRITPSGKIQFAAPYLSGDASLLRYAVERITFTDTASELAIDRLFLTTGERIAGEVQQMDGETVLLKAGSAGYLRIPRSVIERIRFGAGSDILVETDFSGKSMAPFRSIEGDWTAQDGMLRAPHDPQRGSENAVIAMSMKQNSPITATATLGSNERAMNFDIVLFSDDVDNGRGRNCVLATFYWGRVNVQGVHNGNHYTIGDDRFQTRDEQKMSVRLSYDPEKARIRVWVNRQEVSQHVVREPISAGSHIAVVSRGPLALERFAVIKGVVPPPSQTRTAAEDKTTVFGADGEHFAATSIRIVDNKAKMKTEYAEMEWDLKQLDEVLFATSGVKQVKPTGDAVIRTSASKFIVTLQGMDEKQVRCSSPIYSELTIDRAALREILLHEME